MSALEITLLALGIIAFILSFIIPEKNEKDTDEAMTREKISEILEEETNSSKGKIQNMVDETVNYSIEKAERSMDRITNEKMLALGEYSDKILGQISTNHQETVFMYDMLTKSKEELVDIVNESKKDTKDARSFSAEALSLSQMAIENAKNADELSRRAANSAVIAEEKMINARKSMQDIKNNISDKAKTSENASGKSLEKSNDTVDGIDLPEENAAEAMNHSGAISFDDYRIEAEYAREDNADQNPSTVENFQFKSLSHKNAKSDYPNDSLYSTDNAVPAASSAASLENTDENVNRDEDTMYERNSTQKQRNNKENNRENNKGNASANRKGSARSTLEKNKPEYNADSIKASIEASRSGSSSNNSDSDVSKKTPSIKDQLKDKKIEEPAEAKESNIVSIKDAAADAYKKSKEHTGNSSNSDKSSDSETDNNNAEILRLHKKGLADVTIARELGLGIGEVRLVIDLFEKH